MQNQDITRRSFIRLASAAAMVATLPAQAMMAKRSKRPNVVMFLSDDQGWGDLSLHGNQNLLTPNIDSLARDGAMFDRFFVCAVCAPTRAEMLTGRYHLRGGVHGVSTGQERLNIDEKTIAETFKAAGYATGAFGKWHNGTQWPYHPNARGFDEYYGFTSGHWGHYFDWKLEHNEKIVWGNGYITDDFTDHAIDFIEQNKDRPFFCYLPYNTPHSPMQVPDKFYEKFDGVDVEMRNRDPEKEELVKTGAALAMVENIDWNVGRVLKKLDELKLADETIVIYFSDNGPNSYRWNDGMKGRKGSTDEGGLRVPMLIRWPGKIKPGTKIPQIAGAIDLLPTLADAAGIDIVSTKPLDGISIKPLLLGTAKNWPDRMIFTHQNGNFTVRTQQYRLDNYGQLFDMTKDPGQYTDISKDKPQIANKLKKGLEEFKQGLDFYPPQKGNKNSKGKGQKEARPFLVAYDGHKTTILPARDGVSHGKIKRGNNAPNCSYFTNWTSTDDVITWDVEVATSGRFKAEVYYTCPKKDLGSTIEVSFNKSKIQGKVSKANNPPLFGEKDDRSDRGSESFVKDFKPLNLGEIKLNEGRGLLTLKALKIPGSQAIDVRGVILTLL
jgi:arylsulfatase A-like enzyme